MPTHGDGLSLSELSCQPSEMSQQPPYLFALYTCPAAWIGIMPHGDLFRRGVNTCRNVFTYKANDVR